MKEGGKQGGNKGEGGRTLCRGPTASGGVVGRRRTHFFKIANGSLCSKVEVLACIGWQEIANTMDLRRARSKKRNYAHQKQIKKLVLGAYFHKH